MSEQHDPSEPPLGSATHGPHIFDLRDPGGGPRFHPRGEHPATWRERRLRDMAIKHRSKIDAAVLRGVPFVEDPIAQIDAMIAHIDARLAAFEAGEDEAKRYAWACLVEED